MLKKKVNLFGRFGAFFRDLFKKTNFWRIVAFLILFLWGATYVFGLAWAFIASLGEHIALIINPMAFPESLHFENYLDAFTVLETGGTPFASMLFNSVWLAFGRTVASMVCTVMAAYALGNFKFFGRRFFLVAMVVCMMIPIYGSGSATYLMYNRLGMYNSPLILLASATGMGNLTLIVMTFFQTLSPAYEEAAKLDGAGYWTIMLKVHIPMLLPSLGAIFILSLIGGWNDYELALYYLPDYPTIATGLYKYESTAFYNMDKPVYYAGLILCALPPLVIFSIFREKLMTSVTIGGLK